jgi:hypothetical protein
MDKGPDVNAQDGEYRTVLQAASSGGFGADLTERGRTF